MRRFLQTHPNTTLTQRLCEQCQRWCGPLSCADSVVGLAATTSTCRAAQVSVPGAGSHVGWRVRGVRTSPNPAPFDHASQPAPFEAPDVVTSTSTKLKFRMTYSHGRSDSAFSHGSSRHLRSSPKDSCLRVPPTEYAEPEITSDLSFIALPGHVDSLTSSNSVKIERRSVVEWGKRLLPIPGKILSGWILQANGRCLSADQARSL